MVKVGHDGYVWTQPKEGLEKIRVCKKRMSSQPPKFNFSGVPQESQKHGRTGDAVRCRALGEVPSKASKQANNPKKNHCQTIK